MPSRWWPTRCSTCWWTAVDGRWRSSTPSPGCAWPAGGCHWTPRPCPRHCDRRAPATPYLTWAPTSPCSEHADAAGGRTVADMTMLAAVAVGADAENPLDALARLASGAQFGKVVVTVP